MSKIISAFGSYADRLQVVIDRSLDRFAPTWFQRYFNWAPVQSTLTYTSVIGRSRIEAAASVVDRDAPAPLRSRPALEKLSGEIPAISEKFKMKSSDLYDFLALQNMTGVDDNAKVQQLLDLLFEDVKRCGDAPMKRLDIMCLEAVSTGIITLNTDNNPDGLAMDAIDLLRPAGNKKTATVPWATIATSKPLTVDFPTVIEDAAARGIKFAKILMSRVKWLELQQSAEVKNLLSNYLGFKQQGNMIATLTNLNQYMEANMYPPIELVDETIGIEKDGIITTIKPWEDDNVIFVPAGPLGVIKNAVNIEQIRPVPQVRYATANRVLISKWGENDPFAEWTKGEINAFPAFEAIDQVYQLSTVD